MKTLIFFHINKTAGTTLREILRRKFPVDSKATVHDVDELLAIPKEERSNIQYLEGHFIFGLHEYLSQPSTYITILRDPVSRVISEYYYLISMLDDPRYAERIGKNTTLEEYSKQGMWYSWNHQTASICGIGKGFPPPYGPVPLSAKDLGVAQENLRKHFMFVGLTERFDESLVLLKRTLGWKIKDIIYLKENVGRIRPPRDGISRETLKMIQQHNELDTELYEFAKQMFEEQISQQDSSFRREVQLLRLINRLPHESIRKGLNLLRAILKRERPVRDIFITSRKVP